MIEYACTKAVKEVEEDIYGEGHIGDRDITMVNDRLNITAGDLEGLFKAIGSYYALDINEVRIPASMEGEDNITMVEFHRAEDDQNDPPVDTYLERWRHGKAKLWTAVFTFTIECRRIQPITLGDIKNAIDVD